MGANWSRPTLYAGAARAATQRPDDSTRDALRARKCRCETPWIERDEENVAHCIACGRDV